MTSSEAHGLKTRLVNFITQAHETLVKLDSDYARTALATMSLKQVLIERNIPIPEDLAEENFRPAPPAYGPLNLPREYFPDEPPTYNPLYWFSFQANVYAEMSRKCNVIAEREGIKAIAASLLELNGALTTATAGGSIAGGFTAGGSTAGGSTAGSSSTAVDTPTSTGSPTAADFATAAGAPAAAGVPTPANVAQPAQGTAVDEKEDVDMKMEEA